MFRWTNFVSSDTWLSVKFCYHSTLVTARKRSLGQGNVFTPVCHSVHGGGVCIQRGLGLGRPPSHGILWDTINKRVVRILLECILVWFLSTWSRYYELKFCTKYYSKRIKSLDKKVGLTKRPAPLLKLHTLLVFRGTVELKCLALTQIQETFV